MPALTVGLVRRGHSSTGGAEQYLGRFAAALDEAGHRAVLFCGPDWARLDWPHGEKRVLAASGPAAFARALERAPKADCDRIFSLERVLRCDCYRAGDGVHAAWLERRARHEPRWRSFFRSLNPKHRQILALESLLFRGGAGQVIANSRLVRDEILAHFDYPPDRIHVIPNGLPPPPDLPPNIRATTRARLGLRPGDRMLLFAGSGWERKGLRFAIDAVNRLRDPRLRFFIAGRGNPAHCPACDCATFLGPVRDMPALLEAADLFILPTLYDPFSNACLEALAAGLPVITTAQNGFSEIIRSGEEGEVVPRPEDTAALAQAIANWLHPVRTATLRAQLRRLGRSYSIERNVAQTLEILLR